MGHNIGLLALVDQFCVACRLQIYLSDKETVACCRKLAFYLLDAKRLSHIMGKIAWLIFRMVGECVPKGGVGQIGQETCVVSGGRTNKDLRTSRGFYRFGVHAGTVESCDRRVLIK